ncbi:MAG: ABC transporter permease [Actinomycetia bacterium]|nr:ABC transporter permease [Actinomycetes bacterium]
MAVKLDYVVRETGNNLRRNLSLTLASVLTVAVSLSLVGASLLIREGVNNATARWKGGIEFIVFLNAEASTDQVLAIQDTLDTSPAIASSEFVDQNKAYEEFKEIFSNQPDLVDNVTPEILPPSFRVVPADPETEVIRALGLQFEDQPGVREVVYAADTIDAIQRLSSIISLAIVVVAFVLLLSSGLLILNTIRMAMFARRREIEVQKLVGATNWFIRVPFMLEGLLQGVLGGVVAMGAVYGLNFWLFENKLASLDNLALLQSFVVDGSAVTTICMFILGVGAAVGMVGSGVAVGRFLDV